MALRWPLFITDFVGMCDVHAFYVVSMHSVWNDSKKGVDVC